VNIGVLAVQGAFAEHIITLEKLDATGFEIRKKADLARTFDGIILPGGESTVMGKLLTELSMLDLLRDLIKNGMPVLGTCAGMILLAKRIGNTEASYLGTMDIAVKRNAYGRQLGSFNAFEEYGGTKIKMPFIRAPYIESVGSGVEIMSVVDGNIVAAKQDNQIAVSFHPELTGETHVHKKFLELAGKQ